MEDSIIWAEEMENFLGTRRQGLYNRIQRGTLPRPLKISGRMCWRREDWERWLANEAQRQGAVVQQEVVVQQSLPVRRGPGRPKGSKNKKFSAEEGRRV